MSIKWADQLGIRMPRTQQAGLYQSLEDDSLSEGPVSRSEKVFESRRKDFTSLLIFIVTGTAFAAVGFATGLHVESLRLPLGRKDILPPIGNRMLDMRYNRTFSSGPTPETNAAWDGLFPTMKGFVRLPIAHHTPHNSTHHSENNNTQTPTLGLALFHELHCLNILRIGFYAALSGNISAFTDEKSPHHVHDHNKRPDDHHLRHCFDYLRQSLICLADTNLEVVDPKLGGTTGWGQRRCRDFDFEMVRGVGEKFGGWKGEDLELAVVA